MEEIVISGISGAFPKSPTMEEFKEQLIAGDDLLEYHDWGTGFQDLPKKAGIVRNADRFDHSFFRIHHKQAERMDVASRMLLEKTFEAIVDAGYNVEQIRGTNTGVYYGLYCTDVNQTFTHEEANDFTILGTAKAMIANRISYWLDVHGPSVILDSACSASLYALDFAYRAIQNGSCDAAIVCASNLSLSPHISRGYLQLGILDKHGLSRPFDADASGCIRGEAVVAVFLQKKKDARRIYANLVHSKINCDGFKEEGIASPSNKYQKQLYVDFYNEINIDPNSVTYLEAHATGTAIGDVIEANTIEEVFCTNRKTPLKIGSLKSNIGHTEACSGLSSVAKMIIAFETGYLIPNINISTLNPKIKGFSNGKIEVVTKLTPFQDITYAINSTGIGGSKAHVLFTPFQKQKITGGSIERDFPRLVTVSGRTEEAVNVLMDAIEKHSDDDEFIRLIHEIFSENTSGHVYRGFIILHEKNNSTKDLKNFNTENRPIWYIFSGIGSQWPSMAKALMKIPLFAQSIKRSHEVLQPKGIDLIEMITEDDSQFLNNALKSFVGIIAIQIALVDILKELGIRPDGMIGHSIGELACAYSDKCLTAEQTLLVAYTRGLAFLELDPIDCTMAAVGINHNKLKDLLPPEIDIACHNGPDNCTVSGPTNCMKIFIQELQKQNIFVREIDSSGIAYHSRYIARAGSNLRSYLQKIIPFPKLRSNRWICTSASEHEWQTDEVKYSSPEYFTNNVLNPVYFEEGLLHVPNNAIVVEVSPHGLLQAILKRSLPSTVDNIALMLKRHENNTNFLLAAFGKLYEAGANLKLSVLYPHVPFPVSSSTPMISPLIKWRHDEQWPLSSYRNEIQISGTRNISISITGGEHEYLKGHIIDGKNLIPAAEYIHLIWETIAILQEKDLQDTSLVLENVRFERATQLSKKDQLLLQVVIHKNSGHFEINDMKNTGLIVSGKAYVPENVEEEKLDEMSPEQCLSDGDHSLMSNKDFYKELKLRGYNYEDIFKTVVCCNHSGTYGRTQWCGNFTSFVDTIAQISILNLDSRELVIPTYIRKVVIDAKKHFQTLETLDTEKPEIPIQYHPTLQLATGGGIQIIDAKVTAIARKRNPMNPILEKYQFVPYLSDEHMELNTAIRLCVQIVVENVPTVRVKTFQLADRIYDGEIPEISVIIGKTLENLPSVQGMVNVLIPFDFDNEEESKNEINLLKTLPNDNSCALIALSGIHSSTKDWDDIFAALAYDGFVMTIESKNQPLQLVDLPLEICFTRDVGLNNRIFLLRKVIKNRSKKIAIKIENTTQLYSWVPELQNILFSDESDDQVIVLYAEKEPYSGILGFCNCLKREHIKMKLQCFFIIDQDSPEFLIKTPFYENQLNKNLYQNIYKNKHWGSYRHIPLKPPQHVKALHASNTLQVRGDLSTLQWIEGPLNPISSTRSDKPIIHVYYSSLNFRDIMIDTGKLSPLDTPIYNRLTECYHGIEFCGKDNDGNRYCGMLPYGGIASLVEANPTLLWKLPDHMSLEESSTITIAYLTVIHGLLNYASMRNGCSILIHAASGAVGQAAINICLYYNCEIFVTVGTPEKVQFIKNTFPQIPEENIGNSRNTSFEKMIKQRTKGRGVDIVLNSLSEQKLLASLRCVAEQGHFVEIGKYDMTKNNNLGMSPFLKGISFHSVQLDGIFAMSIDEQMKLHAIMQNMIYNRIVKPICRTVFDVNDIESAFRFMASGKHIGKVIIKIRDEENDIHSKPIPVTLQAQPRVLCQKENSYVIIGGLGGCGLELIDWLVIRGARNVVIGSRNGVKNGYQSYKINLWESYGVTVIISTEDITTEQGIRKILQTANTLGPVAGIFNLAMILEDDEFDKQTIQKFIATAQPKSIATIILDKLSRAMCPDLQHFVVFSSMSCGRGNIHQTNYGMSNSSMERICESRRENGLPALAVQWGTIGDVGIVAEIIGDNSNVAIGGTLKQPISSCLRTLDTLMRQPHAIVSSIVVAIRRYTSADIVQTAANILGVNDLKSISMTWTFPELGMDSMMAIELKQVLECEFNINLTPEHLKTMTFEKLTNMKNEKHASSKEGNCKKHTGPQLLDDISNSLLIRIPLLGGKSNEISVGDNLTAFIFPGSSAMEMESLAKNLPFQSLCFQYLSETVDITSLTEQFAKLITNKLEPNREFFIIAYSLGTIFALEVTKILETQGHRGHVWFLDGSPDHTKILNNPFSGTDDATDDEKLQRLACFMFIKTLKFEEPDQGIAEHLNKIDGWEMKKMKCFNISSKQFWDELVVERVLDNLYALLKQSQTYEFTGGALESNCHLIKTPDNGIHCDPSYGLQKYFKRPITLHEVDVDHFSVLPNQRTADFIIQFVTSQEQEST